ncbi:hypothetical protein [Lactobacillus hominis]|uniref:hypothetical protein n=1 Tax=Lactobacillus hominis TaxID=1203033 RepID=UPI0023F31F2D|nr:hypothetical protein [Lactobacillus hominis]
MMNDTVDYLLNYAFDQGISYELTTELSLDAPSASRPKRRKMIINLNLSNKKELPLQIAHEIGHILNQDDGVLYFSTIKNHDLIEADATKTGIKILADYYFNEMDQSEWNVDNFMNYYCIPSYLRDWCYSLLTSDCPK